MTQILYLPPPAEGVIKAVKGPSAPLPLYMDSVPAGFPSPAEDYSEENLDINDYLVQHPAATYYVRVKGDSMTGVGIHDGDLLVVDRSLKPQSGSIVLAVINGEVTVKRLICRNDRYTLQAENPAYPSIPVPDGIELMVWGVVTYVIHHPE